MKEFEAKLPYAAPKIKVVSFKVERGFEMSEPEINRPSGAGLRGNLDPELEYMMFISRQQAQGAQMGDQMYYFSEGEYFGR